LIASEASTVNVAIPPAQIVTSDGFVVIEATEVTVNVAAVEVKTPHAPLTTTL
jgi:hypothetical protein